MFLPVLMVVVLVVCGGSSVESASAAFRTWKFSNCSFDNIDGCARIVMLYGARDLVLPDNEQDMKPHCDEEKSAVKCVSDWGRKCLKGFARQLMHLLLAGATKNIKERCAPEGAKWYLKNSKCVIDSANSLHDCMDVLKNEVAAIKRNPTRDEWLPTGCCYLDKFKNCFDTSIIPFCDAEGTKFMNWCRDAYTQDLTDLACSKELSYTGSKCKELVSNIKPKPENSTEKEPKSVFAPIYKLFIDYTDIDKDNDPKSRRKPN